MTRHAAFALALSLCAGLAGCATGTDDDVAVVTASLGDQEFVLTEVHGDDGFIEVELYYAVGQSEEIAGETYRWPAADPQAPVELLERLREVDPEILRSARLLSGDLEPVIDLGAAWPRLLQQARVEQELHVDRVDLCERSALRDCETEAN